jgi:hypothetical protein
MPNEEIYTFLLDMSNNALIPAVMRLARLVFYQNMPEYPPALLGG